MYEVEYYSAFSMEKSASSLNEAATIMKQIYEENPSYWPHGLSVKGHDDMYLVRDSMSKQACGFVGWQQWREAGKSVGCYTIGILPEHRGRGMAKEAVAKILSKHASAVDEVRAFIVKENIPSQHVANALGIPIHH